MVCKAVTSFREIEEMEEDLILPAFRKLKFVDCNKPFWRRLLYKAFQRAKHGCDRWHDYERSVAPYEEAAHQALAALFQSYIDDAGYQMQIIRVDMERRNQYRVFYVSEYPFADGNRFPEFLETVRFFFPFYRLNLRHIRDVDGHFVTIEEYRQRMRK